MLENQFGPIEFKIADLEKHGEIAVQFRADSFVTSFGTEEAFWEEDGKGGERYLQWLKEKSRGKFNVFHVWLDEQIIGQVEAGEFKYDPSWGYINLFYLIETHRGKGLANYLEEFATNYFQEMGLTRAKLSVSPSNKRAVRFYEKHGWMDMGPRPFKGRKEHELTHQVHFMEKYY